jgi:hypothetical protein
MPSDFFIRSLLRVAQTQGREVLEAIVTSQFEIVASGGKQLVSGTANGKSFSYNVPAALQLDGLMAKAEEALELFDGSTTAQITALLSTRTVSRTVGRFRSSPRSYFPRGF